MNRYDYVIQHAEAIRDAAHLAFDSASNEAVQTGNRHLNGYAIVDWILGEESNPDATLSGDERSLLRDYLTSGGALFISGSEIGFDLDGCGRDPNFYNQFLRADYDGDDADTYAVYGSSGPFSSLSFRFDAPGMYDVDYPDRLQPTGGSIEALRYHGGAGGIAGIRYANPGNPCERVVTFGFPFETIQPGQRSRVMSAVLGFLDACTESMLDRRGWLPLVLRDVGGTPEGCSNVAVNGGFERELAWVANPEGQLPYSTAQAHGGSRSGIVGYDTVTWSSVRQEVMLPSGSDATLRLWLYPISEGDHSGDWQYVSLLDESRQSHTLEIVTSNAQEWQLREYDISQFTGQQVTIVIGARNYEDGNLTRAYVDDVELEVCP
jgi:hypothetical protein